MLMKCLRASVLLSLALSPLLLTTKALAEYELPQTLLGYKMVLVSSTRMHNQQAYIGFLQFKNMTPPFVLIQTKGYDFITAEIVSERLDDRLVGKIMLPPKLTGDDVQELRINGYTVLWKNLK